MRNLGRASRVAACVLPLAAALAAEGCGSDTAPAECTSPSECAGQDGFCGARACTAGACGFAATAQGTALPAADQTAGDCRILVCDGAGEAVSVPDDLDLPGAVSACTLDVCTNGTPRHPPAEWGRACSEGGGLVCDGFGACVECLTAATCPGTDGACEVRSCIDGACGFTPTGACVACVTADTCPGTDGPCGVRTCVDGICGLDATTSGTALPGEYQVLGDCHVLRCNGFGTVVSSIFDFDVPVDGNACTLDVCSGGTPSNPPAPAGTRCGDTGLCDGASVCVP